MANRKIGSHEMNLESSRSHSIATVYCETEGGDTGQIPCYGKVSFVDLAGSERVKDTKTIGGMLKETSAINRSLFTLGKVSSSCLIIVRALKTSPPCLPCSDLHACHNQANTRCHPIGDASCLPFLFLKNML